ncbi:MAG: 4Fe-4S binding protein [Lentisphaeria bacterium]|nr:4Fe-4S binding protein [Lentisphaeria bacterium]
MKATRKIIHIDDKKCNGCGACIPNCPEGALQLIDGKARLISDLFCDGLGACIGECPLGAISVIEREAEPYDERKVMVNIVKQGENTIKAHLSHLKSHGENKLYDIAVAYLQEQGIAVPGECGDGKMACGCPSSLAKFLDRKPAAAKGPGAAPTPTGEQPSTLRQWPVQLHLLNPNATYFDDADLLIAADCVAYAYGDFHRKALDGKILVIFCPKLDQSTDAYIEKLAEIFRRHPIKSVTVLRMEVPCCGGTTMIVEKACEVAGVRHDIKVQIVGIDGEVKG